MDLKPHQVKAFQDLKNRGVLRGDVGSGKSRIALMWYLRDCKGSVRIGGFGDDVKPLEPRALYIITTAKKRDDLEWEKELVLFGMGTTSGDGESRPETYGWSGAPVVVDSWNNIKRYAGVSGATFLFDEQRLVGSGAWVKAFYQIARKNRWVILTATPGDDWADYIPLFVANRFYRSKAQFLREHAVYNTYAPYPKVDRWVDTDRLEGLRKGLLVEVDYATHTKRNMYIIPTEYDTVLMDRITKDRWNPWENAPIQDAGELFRCMRKASNQDRSRAISLEKILSTAQKLIVFYSFDYELEMLRSLAKSIGVTYAEWNGHHHQPIPNATQSPIWMYLVNYTGGSDGWNCVSTNSILFYSLTYSYKTFIQAQGRIDRMNTPFAELNYYVLRNQSDIDQHIWKALTRKKNFNERAYLKKIGWEEPEEISCP